MKFLTCQVSPASVCLMYDPQWPNRLRCLDMYTIMLMRPESCKSNLQDAHHVVTRASTAKNLLIIAPHATSITLEAPLAKNIVIQSPLIQSVTITTNKACALSCMGRTTKSFEITRHVGLTSSQHASRVFKTMCHGFVIGVVFGISLCGACIGEVQMHKSKDSKKKAAKSDSI